jgi:hypothetical protein
MISGRTTLVERLASRYRSKVLNEVEDDGALSLEITSFYNRGHHGSRMAYVLEQRHLGESADEQTANFRPHHRAGSGSGCGSSSSPPARNQRWIRFRTSTTSSDGSHHIDQPSTATSKDADGRSTVATSAERNSTFDRNHDGVPMRA